MKHCTFFVLTYICLLSQLFAQQDSVTIFSNSYLLTTAGGNYSEIVR